MKLVDSHCHIHSSEYSLDREEVLKAAKLAGVDKIVCVGVDGQDSALAVKFAQSHEGVWCSVGLHPHDAKLSQAELDTIQKLAKEDKVVAIGEIGLDYYYSYSNKSDQKAAFKAQLAIAKDNQLPVIFHIRGSKDNPADAFEDAMTIVDDSEPIKGVVHSFSAGKRELEMILERNLYVGVNGIVTFKQTEEQIAAVKAIPADRLLLETDAPYLTPVPFRGKINQPMYVEYVAEQLAASRGTEKIEIAKKSSLNVANLLAI